MSGFMNDEQIDAYKAGLQREREGYEAQVKAAEITGDKEAKAKYTNRIAQVDEELANAEKLVSKESSGELEPDDDAGSAKSQDK